MKFQKAASQEQQNSFNRKANRTTPHRRKTEIQRPKKDKAWNAKISSEQKIFESSEPREFLLKPDQSGAKRV